MKSTPLASLHFFSHPWTLTHRVLCVLQDLEEDARNSELNKLSLKACFSNYRMKLKRECSDCILADFQKQSLIH